MQFLQLLGALICFISSAGALPQSVVTGVPTNTSTANKTPPHQVINGTFANATFANLTSENSDCESSGNCGIVGPLPPINPPKPPPPYGINCDHSANCNTLNCGGIENAIDNIIEQFTYMKPSATYKKGVQMACRYCDESGWGPIGRDAVCAWVEGPDGSELTINEAWVLLKHLRRLDGGCRMCGRNPTPKGEIRVDYTVKIQPHCQNRDKSYVGGCPNY